MLPPGLSAPEPAPRTVDVGWIIDVPKGSLIFDAPRRLGRTPSQSDHAKSVAYCPAVVDYEARTFEIACPIDVNIRIDIPKEGEPRLVTLDGQRSTIRGKHLGQMLKVIDRREWRHPERPILQIIAPYLFFADEPCWINQLPPYMHFRKSGLPGIMIGGRFPIHIWPRHLMWAFEWHDTQAPLQLRRGEPWFYCRFETMDPNRHVRVIEAEMTPDLKDYVEQISTVTNYVSRTFSLFQTAMERRPSRLLTPKRRD